ncbi:hypothetical protein [Haloferax sp. ATB1]|uniref:hypothetical protein n=1 Tax=Haloferax sp. ATB1 TaxID=1508454 RepID=UPI0005B1FC52|nr:hypothetical protein [Haloferax sp. ATB1]
MNDQPTRRSFLRAGVAGGVTASVVAAGAGSASAAERTTVSGKIVAKSGATASNDEINAAGAGYFTTRTDREGKFEIEVRTNSQYELCFYKADSRSDLEPTKDGVPHVYMFEEIRVGTQPVDLGDVLVPTADLVDVRAVKPDGEPLLGGVAQIRDDGFGTNPGRVYIDDDGYAVIEGSDVSGFEVVGDVTVEVEPPRHGDYPDATYSYPLSVDGPTTVTATVSKNGVSWDASDGVTGSDGEMPPATQTPEPTTTTPEPTTESEHSTDESGSPSGTTTPASQNASTPATPSRGFLSNGASTEELDALIDPFVLTVGGFLLSVLGIAHNLVRGD